MSEDAQILAPSVFPVSVLVERRMATVGRWTEPQWEAIAVIAGEDVSGESSRTRVHHDDKCDRYLWTGLRVELFKDGCESYWYNLMSGKARLFVVCFEDDEEGDDEMELRPVIVTANQDEANAHMESDDPVYSVPMPDQVLKWVERFVVNNYVPEVKRKRKRTNWVEDTEYAKRDHQESNRQRRH